MSTLKTNHIGILTSIAITAIFVVCGFIITAGNTYASTSTSQSSIVTVSYTMSVVAIHNSNGTYTTTVINGCAPGSSDIYDMNTGKKCTYNTSIILIGCAPNSGDKYDVNTGQLCKNDTSLTKYTPTVTKPVENVSGKVTLNILPNVTIRQVKTPKITFTTVTDLQEVQPVTHNTKETIEPNTIGQIPQSENSDNTLSGRQKIANSLTASAQKAGSILHGPMSVWLILLIIIIILGGGYGIYSLIFNTGNGLEELKPESTNTSEPTVAKQEAVKVNTSPTVAHVEPQAKPIQPTQVVNPEQPKTQQQQQPQQQVGNR